MAHDLLRGSNTKNWGRSASVCGGHTVGSLPTGAQGYAPTSWWKPEKAEAKVQELMKSGGTFGMSLPREAAERHALAWLREKNIGIDSSGGSGVMGSWLMSEKEQLRILNKIDDVRYDLRLVSRRVYIGLGCLAGALAVLGAASIYRTSAQDNRFNR
jgi:hypothetical protein